MEKAQIDFFVNGIKIFHLEQVNDELWNVFGHRLLEVEASYCYNYHLSVTDSHRLRCPHMIRMVLSVYATRHCLQGFGKPRILLPVINSIECQQILQLVSKTKRQIHLSF